MGLIVRLLTALSALFLMAMMALTFADVMGRYLLNAPIPGAAEIIGLMLGVVMFAALPRVTGAEDHITVDLFDHAFRGRVRRVRHVAILLATLAAFLMIALLLFGQAERKLAAGAITEDLFLPEAPFFYLFSALAAVTGLTLLGALRRAAARGRGQEGKGAGAQPSGPS